MRQLQRLAGVYAICRLGPTEGIPFWCVKSEPLLSVTRTDHELSIVCAQALVPAVVRAERGFGAWRVAQAMDFSITGVMAALTAPLATAGISVFVLSTFDTDYLLAREENRERVEHVLTQAGFTFSP